MLTRTSLHVDLKAIATNVTTIKHHAGNAKVMAVLKANAYGVGAEKILPAVLAGGAQSIGVATAQEAQTLRKYFNGPLYILGACLPSELPALLPLDITFPIQSYTTLTSLHKLAQTANKIAQIHLLIDTGMGRLGVLPEEIPLFLQKIFKLRHIKLCGAYSHLSNAFTPNDPHTQKQIASFKACRQTIIKFAATHTSPVSPCAAEKNLCFHLANSAGLHNYPHASFNMVRSGINLYGIHNINEIRRYALKPALTLTSRVIAVRQLKKGAPIGYNVTYHLPQAATVATISAGYADGIPLALSNHFHVLIKDHFYPIIGRVSMDYFTVDLGDNPQNIKINDLVILFGKAATQKIAIEEWAQLKQTHAYDIITALSARVPRAYTYNSPPLPTSSPHVLNTLHTLQPSLT